MQQHVDRYAVIGNPIAHSKSPYIHAQFAQQTQQLLTYEAILSPLTQFSETVTEFMQQGGKGINITLPFKQQAVVLVQECSSRATLAGAINTIKFISAKHWYGDNTDGIGLIRDLENHGWQLQGQRILLLGAGGAIRGVLKPLLDKNPQFIVIANRTLSKAQELAALFSNYGRVEAKEFLQLTKQQFDFVINGTAASLQNQLPPLPETILSKNSCCYDMMYQNGLTPFLQWAKQHGCAHLLDGIGMLVEQAAEAFYLWRGVKPETTSVIKLLTQGMLDVY